MRSARYDVMLEHAYTNGVVMENASKMNHSSIFRPILFFCAIRRLLLLCALCLAGSSFETIGSDRSNNISGRVEAMPEDIYIGGMPPAMAEIASFARQQLHRANGAALPECEPPDSIQGTIVATSIGSPPPASKAATDPTLRELQTMLTNERRFVRDAAAFIIGEIGPAALPLKPDLAGDDIDRSAWFSHALGRIDCEGYSLGNSLDLIPEAARSKWLGSEADTFSSRSKVQLIAKLLEYPDLRWPDRFFTYALDAQKFALEGETRAPIEAVRIQMIADRMIDESSPMPLRLDLASLMSTLGHAARPAAEKMWALTQHPDEHFALMVTFALLDSGSERAVDAGLMLLERSNISPAELPEEFCGMRRAVRMLETPLRARLNGGTWREAAQAAEKLGCLDPLGNAGVLRVAVEHPSWEVQLAAVGALTESARTDPKTREVLQTIRREHWSGLVRREAEKALNPPPPQTENSNMLRLDLNCFHRCLTDHLRRCGDDQGIADGLYISPTLGELDIEWERARRIPQPQGFPVPVPEDSRADYGTSTYLRVEDGWLYATDRWHYDGEIAFVDDRGIKTPIGNWGDDAAAIIETPHFGRVLLGGSLFGVGEAGLLASLERRPEGWRMIPRTALPSPPWGWAFAPDGTLLVADPYEAVAVLADGRIESLACPVRPPSHVPRNLLALAKGAPAHRSQRKQNELSDTVILRESVFAEQRNRNDELARNPGEREPWERPELVRTRLYNDLVDLLEAYLVAGRAEAAIELIDTLPDGLVEIGAARRFQLHAAADRPHEARAQLDAATDTTDMFTLKLQIALALAQRQLSNARAILTRIESLSARNRDHAETPDRYLEMLQWLAASEKPEWKEPASGDDKWPAPIHAYLAGRISEKDLVIASHRRDGRVDHEKLCEALFYKGLELAIAGRSRLARKHFRAVADLGIERLIEHAVAVVVLK